MEQVKTNEGKPSNARKKKIGFIVLSATILLGVAILLFYLRYKATHITTDDAFIDGRVHTISARVKGSISRIFAEDNQFVRKGDLLMEIDPADYDVRVREAQSGLQVETSRLAEVEARIEAARKQMEEISASIQSARANLELQEANAKQAESDAKRAENLFAQGTISRDRYEKTQTAYAVALAQVKAAREHVTQVEKSLEAQASIVKQTAALRASQLSLIREREAKLEAARLAYGYTKVYSPSDGYVTKRSVEVGNHVEVGQPLMAIVALDDIWVTANYKETQLEKVRPGQKVRFTVDTYPGKRFTGKVESIMSGTGAVFSLFPPENATGNYVKVVQRIPVRIALDRGTDKDHLLRIGMSVVPTILIEE